MADRFDQLSEAFFNLGSSSSNSVQAKLRGEKAADNNNNVEDSSSSSSIINAAIRFDAQSALKDSMKQSKLNFGAFTTGDKNTNRQKNFDIKLVDGQS